MWICASWCAGGCALAHKTRLRLVCCGKWRLPLRPPSSQYPMVVLRSGPVPLVSMCAPRSSKQDPLPGWLRSCVTNGPSSKASGERQPLPIMRSALPTASTDGWRSRRGTVLAPLLRGQKPQRLRLKASITTAHAQACEFTGASCDARSNKRTRPGDHHHTPHTPRRARRTIPNPSSKSSYSHHDHTLQNLHTSHRPSHFPLPFSQKPRVRCVRYERADPFANLILTSLF